MRGRSYQYPILGRAVIDYTSRRPFVVKAESSARQPSTSEGEHIIAGLGHASMFVGFSLFLSPILWATTKTRSHFLSHHLFQASLFQMMATMFFSCTYFLIWGSGALISSLQFMMTPLELITRISEPAGINYFLVGLFILFVLLFVTAGIYVAIATVQAFRGKEFHYPFIGKWLLYYVQ